MIDGGTAKTAVKQALGFDYSTSADVAKNAISSFAGKWPEAVVHAERVRTHHIAANTPPPANPSTEVCALVRALNDSAPEHMRHL